jgi:hypothetical protein
MKSVVTMLHAEGPGYLAVRVCAAAMMQRIVTDEACMQSIVEQGGTLKMFQECLGNFDPLLKCFEDEQDGMEGCQLAVSTYCLR